MSEPSVAESTYITDEMEVNLKDADEQQDKEIKEYQKQYDRAVENLEIDKANEIKRDIDQIKAERSQKKIEYLRNDFEQRLVEIHESFGYNKKKIMRFYYNTELDTRTSFSTQFIMLQKQHISVLSNIENSIVDFYLQNHEYPKNEDFILLEIENNI